MPKNDDKIMSHINNADNPMSFLHENASTEPIKTLWTPKFCKLEKMNINKITTT